MTASSAAAAAVTDPISSALLRFPHGVWIAMPEAARLLREAGLPGKALTTVVRTGRRRGVLRTRRTAGVHYVQRVLQELHRQAPAPAK